MFYFFLLAFFPPKVLISLTYTHFTMIVSQYYARARLKKVKDDIIVLI